MRRLLPSVALVLLTCAAWPAVASAVPIDPIIGVRGREAGSEPSTSSAFFEMVACTDSDLVSAFGSNIFCLEYDILQSVEEITSLTLQFRDAGGLIANSLLFEDSETGLNGFDALQLLEDGFSVRFFFGEGGNLLCPQFEGDDIPCDTGSTIQVYLHIPDGETPNPPYSASLRAVNDITVPEPALLVLLGTGLVVAGRRVRNRANQA